MTSKGWPALTVSSLAFTSTSKSSASAGAGGGGDHGRGEVSTHLVTDSSVTQPRQQKRAREVIFPRVVMTQRYGRGAVRSPRRAEVIFKHPRCDKAAIS